MKVRRLSQVNELRDSIDWNSEFERIHYSKRIELTTTSIMGSSLGPCAPPKLAQF